MKVKPIKESFKHASDKLFDLVRASVAQRMIADVPVATFLSGGIDSSIITYFAKQINPDLNTYSIGFDTTNELSYAKLVATKLKTNHHEFKLNKDNVLEYLDQMVYHMDEPIGADPGFLPIFVLSKEVSKYNKVVLSGDGADEIFAGYDRYKLLEYGKWLKKLALFKSKNPILNILNKMRGKSDKDAFLEITRVFNSEDLEKLGLTERLPKMSNTRNSLLDAQKFDINNLLPKDFFMKADKMSNAFGLEQRTPFVDYKIVELGLSLPNDFKLKLWNEKKILKETFKKYIPVEVYKRRKQGFNVPIDYWFENVLKDKLIKLLEKNKHELYDYSYIFDLFKELKDLKSNFKARNVIAQKLWTVLMFEMWYERFM